MSAPVPSPTAIRMGNEGRTEAGDVQVMSATVTACVIRKNYNLEGTPKRPCSRSGSSPMSGAAKPSWGARQFPKDGSRRRLRPARQRIARTTTMR